MKRDTPSEFADAVAFDKAIRRAGGRRGETFLHSTCQPLDTINFDDNITGRNEHLWGNECEGMCGV